MKHLFVPYELAKLAKEKGFDEECYNYYTLGRPQDDSRLIGFRGMNGWQAHVPFNMNTKYKSKENKDEFSAPLYQQLVDWFRIKHGYSVVVIGCEMLHEENEDGLKGTKGGYTWCISKRSKVASALWQPAIEDYYECFTKALEEAFKLIG
jgi:hypothetical protein